MSRSNEYEYRDLVTAAICGDEAAFEQLCQKYSKSILYQAKRFISDPNEAEDAAQEAVIAIYRNISTLKDPNAFVSWMYRLTKFVCLNHVRNLESKRGRQAMVDIDDYAETLEDERESDPAKLMVEDERIKTVRGIIEKLPPKQREAVILFYYEGLSYNEVAAAQGTTRSTVSTNIMKAKKKIARDLESVITMAIAVDAGMKLTGINIPAFQAACQAGVAKSAAAGLGHGAVTAAGAYAMKGGNVYAAAGTALSTGLSVAAAAAILVSVTAVSSAPKPIVDTSPALAAYMPDADIAFLGGECDCGHVNPQSAALSLSDGTDMTERWEILSGGAPVSSGDGEAAQLGGLPDGDYTINYTIVSLKDGRKAHSERAFHITSEPTEGLYL
ncbi:MAG: sigma-70 family RNA polymerase sigma factor [Clostridiales Family XIII bacterium]|jgi:RNA polymerase sigma-70 factor (ECF subfamily)|nr:sigma-70 family RNA polymerase sigma factor [Clostridiales Family XIII bacterium]